MNEEKEQMDTSLKWDVASDIKLHMKFKNK